MTLTIFFRELWYLYKKRLVFVCLIFFLSVSYSSVFATDVELKNDIAISEISIESVSAASIANYFLGEPEEFAQSMGAADIAVEEELESIEAIKEESDDNQAPASNQSTAQAPAPPARATSMWPMRGAVTADFGVPHWPWQPTHTGVDISSGRPSGITPIVAFKDGVVVDVVYSYYGLGHYVVVKHNKRLTSYYGHMSTMVAKIGQTVKMGDLLGYEGSTGLSTGPHIHFEVRLDGRIVNPRNYVAGNPY
jgi:murein DD-endopeptidase MepM/ murein hydrolase activator NlpD